MLLWKQKVLECENKLTEKQKMEMAIMSAARWETTCRQHIPYGPISSCQLSDA